MPLLIKTTGLEEYAPGGKARVKVLVIGGPGAGKTRWSSYFPKPIFADCEAGLASVADREMPYATINTSQDMLDLLAFLKQESAKPTEMRRYQTVVIDTLDTFQRKIKNEWMEKENKQTFSGWEAWGYLNSRLQMLMTRLLNLDMNVVVNLHFKDKTTKDDVTGRETHELAPQLQGELSDTVFNDFDLVGWLGTYWEAVDGERVQRRGITFKPTPDKPFLKDRLYVTPTWLEIDFAPSDYEQLFERVQAKVAELKPNTLLETIETDSAPAPAPVAPGQIGSGAIGNSGPGGNGAAGVASKVAELTYQQMDKPTLAQKCIERGIKHTVEGTPIRGNTLKAELIAALQAADDKQQNQKEQKDAAPPTAPAAPAVPAQQPAPRPDPAPAAAPAQRVAAPVSSPASPSVQTSEGLVNPQTGELLDDEPQDDADPENDTDLPDDDVPQDDAERAQAVVTQQLGGVVVAPAAAAPTPAPAAQRPTPEAKPAPKAAPTCQVCGKDLTDEDPDIVKLSWIKYRQQLCSEHYQAKKAGR